MYYLKNPYISNGVSTANYISSFAVKVILGGSLFLNKDWLSEGKKDYMDLRFRLNSIGARIVLYKKHNMFI